MEALDDEVADTEQPPPSSTAQQEATAQPLGPQDDAHRATQPAEANGAADTAQEVVVSSRRPVTQETRIASRPTHDDLDVDAVSVVSEDSVLTTVDPTGAKLEWTHWRQELLDKLVLATLQEVKKAGPHRYLRSVASNVLFPEVCFVALRFVATPTPSAFTHGVCRLVVCRSTTAL